MKVKYQLNPEITPSRNKEGVSSIYCISQNDVAIDKWVADGLTYAAGYGYGL